MGKFHVSVNDDVETRFKDSIENRKKGDVSKRIEYLMELDVKEGEKQIKKESKLVKKIFQDMNKLILKLYNADELSLIAANKVAMEWDKLKSKHNPDDL